MNLGSTVENINETNIFLPIYNYSQNEQNEQAKILCLLRLNSSERNTGGLGLE